MLFSSCTNVQMYTNFICKLLISSSYISNKYYDLSTINSNVMKGLASIQIKAWNIYFQVMYDSSTHFRACARITITTALAWFCRFLHQQGVYFFSKFEKSGNARESQGKSGNSEKISEKKKSWLKDKFIILDKKECTFVISHNKIHT